MTTTIYLALFLSTLYGFMWCFNRFMCELPTHEHAYAEGQNALRRANRDLNSRVMLKRVKE